MIGRFKPYILLMPASLFIGLVFAAGLYTASVQSLGYFPQIGFEKITLKYYRLILKDESFLSSFKFSLYISTVSSFLSTLFGVVLSYMMLKSKSRDWVKKIVSKVPMLIPHIIASLLVYNMISQSGFLARILNGLKLIDEKEQFYPMLFDKNAVGIILTYMWKEIPFVAMVVYNSMSRVEKNLEYAARNLRAKDFQVFNHVYLPMAMPAIVSSFLIIFAYSFGAFEVPFLLGPSYPKTLPVKAYIEYSSIDLGNRPYAMAINMVLMTVSFLMILAYDLVFRRLKR